MCSSLYHLFLLSNIDINLCVFQMYFMNLINMLNIGYCLPMNQKTLYFANYDEDANLASFNIHLSLLAILPIV
jgi:hypothetical protein